MGGWGGAVHTCMVTYDLNDPGELNKNLLLSLHNNLHTFYGNEADSNPYIDLNINAKYYDPDEFLSCFKHTVNPIFTSINIQSLLAKKQALTDVVNEYAINHVPVKVIAIQEVPFLKGGYSGGDGDGRLSRPGAGGKMQYTGGRRDIKVMSTQKVKTENWPCHVS